MTIHRLTVVVTATLVALAALAVQPTSGQCASFTSCEACPLSSCTWCQSMEFDRIFADEDTVCIAVGAEISDVKCNSGTSRRVRSSENCASARNDAIDILNGGDGNTDDDGEGFFQVIFGSFNFWLYGLIGLTIVAALVIVYFKSVVSATNQTVTANTMTVAPARSDSSSSDLEDELPGSNNANAGIDPALATLFGFNAGGSAQVVSVRTQEPHYNHGATATVSRAHVPTARSSKGPISKGSSKRPKSDPKPRSSGPIAYGW